MTNFIEQRTLAACLIKIIDYRGKTPKKLSSNWTSGGFRALSANNVKFSGLTKLDSIKYVDAATYKKWMKEEVEYGDLLLTSEAPAGRVMLWMSQEKIVLSQRLFGLRTKNDVYNKYLKYYLQSSTGQAEINKNCSGSTVLGISAKMFNQIQVFLPSYNSQMLIGDFLYNIDSKIELNNHINAELQAMAKLIYDYWFVQFDFPDKNGRPYKSSDGKMVWNENLKKEIPQGWVQRRLDNIEQNIITGKTPPTYRGDFFNGEVPFITIGDIRGNMHIVTTKNTLSKDGADYQKRKYIPRDAICVSCIASPGLVGFSTATSQTNQQINSIVCAQEENRYYLFFYLNDYFQSSNTVKNGNTFANMNKEDFSSILLAYPIDTSVLRKFTEIIQPIMSRILCNSLENKKLEEMRDWVLPMLVNGQVNVR